MLDYSYFLKYFRRLQDMQVLFKTVKCQVTKYMDYFLIAMCPFISFTRTLAI